MEYMLKIPEIVRTPYVEELWHPEWSGENKIQGGSEKKAKNPERVHKIDRKSKIGDSVFFGFIFAAILR